mgnify:FL=1|tara:strand:- start:7751 stop:8158 length:408 start_codon:yes stop_codon:yes gene_type:complete
MSLVDKWKLNRFAQADPRLSSMSRRVLFLLCSYYNDKSRQCNPSQLRMSRDLGTTDRSIRNGLRDLLVYGYIKIIKKGNVGFSTKYAIDFKLQENFFQATGKNFPKDQEHIFLRTNLRTYLEEEELTIIKGGESG